MKTTINVPINANGIPKPSSRILCNQYETGVSEFKITLDSSWINSSYFYYLVVMPPEDSGVAQYAVPIIPSGNILTFDLTSGITWHLGGYKFSVVAMSQALPESGVIPTTGTVSISDVWEGEVNAIPFNIAQLLTQPVDPAFTLLYTNLLALKLVVESNSAYAEEQGDYAKAEGDKVAPVLVTVTAQGNTSQTQGNTAESKGLAAETKGNAAEVKGNAAAAKGDIAAGQGTTAAAQGALAAEQGLAAKAQGDAAEAQGNAAETQGNLVAAVLEAVTAQGNTAESKGSAAETKGNTAETKGNAAETKGNTAASQGAAAETKGNAAQAIADALTAALAAGEFDGDDGVSIVSIIKTGTVGLVDTYTITKSDETTSTFDITNGEDGTDAVSIVSVAKTSTEGLIDTYTITFSDESTTTFTVTNGKDGTDGITPHIDSTTKNWFIGTTNTGILAEGLGDMLKSEYGEYKINANATTGIAELWEV